MWAAPMGNTGEKNFSPVLPIGNFFTLIFLRSKSAQVPWDHSISLPMS